MKSALSWIPITLGLTVLVLSLAVAVIRVSTSPSQVSTGQDIRTQAAEVSGSLALSPSSGQYSFSPNQSYPVGILVDSAGASIDGVDVTINFDPKKAQVTGNNLLATTLFERVVVNKIDNSLGQIKFSALTFNAKPLTGIMATFSYKPTAAGEVDFNFSYSPGSKSDSIIAQHGTVKNILTRVENGKYVFK